MRPGPPQRRRRPRINATERKEFLDALRAGWTVTHAAKRTGRDKRRFYGLREVDEAFAAEWDDALEAFRNEAENFESLPSRKKL